MNESQQISQQRGGIGVTIAVIVIFVVIVGGTLLFAWQLGFISF